jgi:DNA-damage-inducible protein D
MKGVLMKKMQVPDGRPVADFLPTISIKAKDLSAEMTSLNAQSNNLKGRNPIEKEHVENNKAFRDMLTKREIIPEKRKNNFTCICI